VWRVTGTKRGADVGAVWFGLLVAEFGVIQEHSFVLVRCSLVWIGLLGAECGLLQEHCAVLVRFGLDW
jgi:hypothetical protein